MEIQKLQDDSTKITKLSHVLQDIQNKHERRIDGLESRMEYLEGNTKQHIESQVSDMKKDITNSFKEDIHTLVDKRVGELEDMKRRGNNISFFNLKEHNYNSGADNKRADEEDIRLISSCVGFDNSSITIWFRLGKKDPMKTYPVK